MKTILIKNLREQAKRRSLSGYTKCLLNCAADALQDDLETRGKVVYCKDCEYFKEIDPCFGECTHLPNGLINDLFWYCADGERKNE